RRVDADVCRELTVRRGCVEEGQRSGRRVNGIGAHGPSGIFVDGIEVSQRGVERDERWVRRRNDLQERQLAVRRVQLEHINANGCARVRSARGNAWSGVGAYVNESWQCAGWVSGYSTWRCIEYARGGGGNRSCTEQRKKLATSQAGRKRSLTTFELFR